MAWPLVVERPTLLGAAAVRRRVHLAMQREELVWVGPPLELLEAVAWRVWPRTISGREREGVVADELSVVVISGAFTCGETPPLRKLICSAKLVL